jgi:hypothetical protein
MANQAASHVRTHHGPPSPSPGPSAFSQVQAQASAAADAGGSEATMAKGAISPHQFDNAGQSTAQFARQSSSGDAAGKASHRRA